MKKIWTLLVAAITVLAVLMLCHISLFIENKVAEGRGDEHHLEESAVCHVFLASL